MRKLNSKRILIVIIILILLSIGIIICIKKIQKENNYNQVEMTNQEVSTDAQIQQKTQEEIEKEELETVKQKGESERIRYYLGKYMRYIEKGDYATAYSILYPEFKQNYFTTQQSYEEYVKKTYPDLIGIECNDIQRQGEYYIVSVTILNPAENKRGIEQKFIIMENNYLDFILSFQVI